MKYLNKVGIPNVIISEHSDYSCKEYLLNEYGDLFKSFEVFNIKTNCESFNKSKTINRGVIESKTPYIAIFDCDCLTKKENINIALELLENEYDVIHPFDRRVKNITNKTEFIKEYDFSTVNTDEEIRPWADGGIVFWNKKSFIDRYEE